MQKRAIWSFILIFVLFMTASATAVGVVRGHTLSARADSIERRIASDGMVYEIISTGNNRLCLRKMTVDGLVTGYYPLPVSEEHGMFTAYHTIGRSGDTLFLYSYETQGNTPEYQDEFIIAYNMVDGKSRMVTEITSPGTRDEYDVFYAQHTAENAVYLGYLDRQERQLIVRRIDTLSGETTDQPGIDMPFPLAAITMTETEEVFALSQDSRVYRFDDGAWVCLFTPLPQEAAANMTTGEKGEVYLFLASPNGTRVMISTPQNRRFVPMDFDSTGLIKLHIAETNRWVGMDEQYRYVVCVDGVRYSFDTLRVSFWALWDAASLWIVAACSFAATALFAVIRRIVTKRRLHLLPKLMIMIIPIFTLGIYILVSIADRYVTEITETGLLESILEYSYDTINEIDAERFAAIDWNAPFEDHYFLALREQLHALSEYRMMAVKRETADDIHNAYVSFWVYRIDQGVVYTAIGGHYVSGLAVKYSEYNAQVAQRDKMIASRMPTSAYLGGSDSNVRWMAVLFPIVAGHELVGYLEVARPMTAIDKAVYTVKRSIISAGVIVFMAVTAALVLLLALSTKTLGKLRRGALAVSGGTYATRVHSRSWDETGEIASAFNNMAQSVETAIAAITEVSNGYSRFVSDKLIELLSKDTISAIHPGDYKRLTVSNLLVYTDSFDNLRDKDFFDALGRFYDVIIPCIVSAGGLISQYSARGLAALFETAPETALRAISTVFAAFDRRGGIPCYMFMSYSGAMLGVTGNGEHLNMITISRLVYESFAVGSAGKRFGTRLIVAQSAFDEMGEVAKRHNCRFLGFMRDEGTLYKLYDFYDCDLVAIKVKKNATKARFEMGVALYYEAAYSKAQRVFVEIIKAFPEDMASREYLRRSHEGVKRGGEPQAIIELR